MRTITTRLFAVILPILAFGVMTSCTNDLDYDYGISEADLSEQPQTPHHITLTKALENLESMMSEMGMDNTRALQRGKWTVQRVPMSAFKPHTRSDGATETGDAIYVVNFDNDEGFAILSADDRLPDDVIAVSSRGNLIDFTPYPEEGYEDTLTLEDLYVPEDDDYLLGSVTPDRVIGGLVTNYVIEWTDSIGGDLGGRFPGSPPPTPPSDPITYTYEYQTVEHIPEMLTTTWHQRSPYNDQCPNRYHYKGFLGITYTTIKPYNFDAFGEWGSDFVKEEDLLAGCVAIATAQILAYNEYPALSDVLGENVVEDWEWLLANHTTIMDPEEKAEAIARQNELYAKLVHSIGVGCDMDYGFYKQQSFTTPVAAKRYLEDIGYSNAERTIGYDLEVVKAQLQNNCPVFIGAISGAVNGHAWVIDGYKKVNTIKIGKNSDGEIVSTTISSTNQYVHCNWGWNSSCDGWFATGLVDESFSPNDDYEFDWWFRLVTYDKPNVVQ